MTDDEAREHDRERDRERDARPAPLHLDVTQLEVPQTAYPSEVMCRKCRNLMIPDDPEGRAWECWLCSRRIEIVLRPPTAS